MVSEKVNGRWRECSSRVSARPRRALRQHAMRDILRFHGHEFTEDMVFGLGAGIDFLFYKNETAWIAARLYRRQDPGPGGELCDRWAWAWSGDRRLDDDEAWLGGRSMIDGASPPWSTPTSSTSTTCARRRHFSAHRIVLVGYDTEAAVAFVGRQRPRRNTGVLAGQPAEGAVGRRPPPTGGNATTVRRARRSSQPLEKAVPAAVDLAVRRT